MAFNSARTDGYPYGKKTGSLLLFYKYFLFKNEQFKKLKCG